MSNTASADVLAVYNQLKDKYDLVLTTTAALDEGFTIDVPIMVGHAHGKIIQLYNDGSDFVLDVMDAAKTKGTHWHPCDVSSSVEYIVDFMEGKKEYHMSPFSSMQGSWDKEAIMETVVCLTREQAVHHMKLNPAPFATVKSGQKTIELRLFDEKRQKISVGDSIVFTNTDTGEVLTKTVVKLHRFPSFEELYKTLPLLQCGYTQADVDRAKPSDMEQYYSAEEQQKYGVVGIELC